MLYVKSKCGLSRRSLVAVDNLHLRDRIKVLNVTQDTSAAGELKKVGGKDQAPCLVIDGKPLYESADLIAELANRAAPLA